MLLTHCLEMDGKQKIATLMMVNKELLYSNNSQFLTFLGSTVTAKVIQNFQHSKKPKEIFEEFVVGFEDYRILGSGNLDKPGYTLRACVYWNEKERPSVH